jgi:ubiquitin-like-specific protease 1C/D
LCIPQFSHNWFKPEEASGLRPRIREILLEEFESARLHDAISKADAYVGCDSIKDGELEADNSKMVVEVGDAAKSKKGISVTESDEASGEFGDTDKTNKCIKVLASEEANMESGYPIKSMEDIVDVAVVNKGPTSSSNKCNEKNAGAVSEVASCSNSVIKDKKGTGKTDSGRSKAEKEGKPIVTASPERFKGTEEVIGSTPIPDAVSDSSVKIRYERNGEVTGSSMPIPDAVCEITGTKVWITRVYRRTSGTTLEPGNWCWSSGGSSRDARRKFIEHFSRK